MMFLQRILFSCICVYPNKIFHLTALFGLNLVHAHKINVLCFKRGIKDQRPVVERVGGEVNHFACIRDKAQVIHYIFIPFLCYFKKYINNLSVIKNHLVRFRKCWLPRLLKLCGLGCHGDVSFALSGCAADK